MRAARGRAGCSKDDGVTPPTLPDKETWRAFKASRHDFQPGDCEHCRQPADKLIWRGLLLVCLSCRDWLDQHERARKRHGA